MPPTSVKAFVKDQYGNMPPGLGGTVGCIQGIVNFDDVGPVDIGEFPAGATPLDWMIEELTDFNAGTNNNMDLGIEGNGDYFANDVAIGTQGVQRKGVSGTDFTAGGVKLNAKTVATAEYTQSGTAATTGQALVTYWYRVDEVS